MSEAGKFWLAAAIAATFLIWLVSAYGPERKASPPPPKKTDVSVAREPEPEPPPPEGTWETTTEVLMTRSCKWVRNEEKGDQLREEYGLTEPIYKLTVPDPVEEKCRKLTIKSPKAAERYLFRKLWSDNDYERRHAVWCDGDYKESPKNEPGFMIAEIKKRPSCVYRVEQEREPTAAGEPTKQTIWLYYSDTERAWTLERRVFTPSKSWLD